MCPGLDSGVIGNNPNTSLVEVTNVSSCEQHVMPQYPLRQGVRYGWCGQSGTFCSLTVVVPETKVVRAHVKRLEYWCGCRQWASLIYSRLFKNSWSLYRGDALKCNYHSLGKVLIMTTQNILLIASYNSPPVSISLEAIEPRHCVIRNVSMHSAFVLVSKTYYIDTRSRPEVTVQNGHVIMVSLTESYDFNKCDSSLNYRVVLMYREGKTTCDQSVEVCSSLSLSARILPTSRFQIKLMIHSSFSHVVLQQKIYFSSLAEEKHPPVLQSGQFNCSVPHYPQFQDHLHCNLRAECEDGQDEETEYCPSSCRGLLATRINKCYHVIYFRGLRTVYVETTDWQCQKMGGRLASVKTRQEQNYFLTLFRHYNRFEMPLGFLTGWHNMPFPYSKFRHWSDGTAIYDLSHFLVRSPYPPSRLVQTMNVRDMRFEGLSTLKGRKTKHTLCEVSLNLQSQRRGLSPELPRQVFGLTLAAHSIVTQTRQLLVTCVHSEITQSWLVCASTSQCRSRSPRFLQSCPIFEARAEENATWVTRNTDTPFLIAMFVCNDALSTVHYTLVCDFRQDCPDSSDESFCHRPSCHGFLCSNVQCVLHSQRCNEFSDCLDDSDEVDCPQHTGYYYLVHEDQDKQQSVMTLDGTGYFTRTMLISVHLCPDTINTKHPCPAGHYRCTPDSFQCLPIYTRCNQIPDCINDDDELDCAIFTCPGHYRCIRSSVCVHGDQMCDGWGQCPQRDDELMCDRTCPEGCQCQGHAILCPAAFNAGAFPQLRYVDAQSSTMTLAEWKGNPYLIRLSLSQCQLSNVSSTNLPDLQFLDLADNYLATIDISVFQQLRNLKYLYLTNNPLSNITNFSLTHIQYELVRMDISNTYIHILSKSMSVFLPNITYLNISSSYINNIAPRGFKMIPKLTELDIRHNPVYRFPVDLLSPLNHLKRLYTSNYRLCCDKLLPTQSNEIQCRSPQPLLAPCNSLLTNPLHVTFFWVILSSSLFGNLFSSVGRFSRRNALFGTTLPIFAVSLRLAHMCMGVHASIILIADHQLFNGHYVLLENTWTTGVACKMAGFMSLVSSEVSLLTLFLATLDHIAVLCFPAASWRLNERTAAIACLVTWFVGALLALVPFLPGLSHLGSNNQSGLCRLTSFHQSGHDDLSWFTVTGAMNIILSALTVASLVVVHIRSPKHLTVMMMDPRKRPLYASTQLLTKLGVTEVACWCWLGVSWAMAWLSVAVAVTGRMREVMVVVLLPVSAAVCPPVYMWTSVSMERRQAQDRRLLGKFNSRLHGAKT